MNKIHIEGLEVFSLIGVYDWERLNQQRLIVDIELVADLNEAALSDNVDDTLNYASIAQFVAETASQSQYQLIEALAHHLMQALCQRFDSIQGIKLKLSKPDILANAKNVAVEFSQGAMN